MSAVWKNKKQLQFGQSDIVLTLTCLIKRYFQGHQQYLQIVMKIIYFLVGGFPMRLSDFSLVGNIINHEVLQ